MPKRPAQSRTISYLFLLINTICWGAALIIVKPALDITTPFRFLMYRYALALPLALPFILQHKKYLTIQNLGKVTIVDGIGTTLALALLYLGLDRTTAIEASLLSTTTPIFVVVAGLLFLKEKQEKREWFGLLLAFVGTLMLTVFPALHSNVVASKTSLEGNILIIGQNVATALYFILAKHWYKNLPKLLVTTLSFALGLVSFFVLSMIEIGSWSNFVTAVFNDLTHVSVLWASFYMAVFGSIIGLTAYIKGQDGIEASEASLFWYLQPLVYVPLGMVLLAETVNLTQIISMIVILIGVMVSMRKK